MQHAGLTGFVSDTTMAFVEKVPCLGPGSLIWEISDEARGSPPLPVREGKEAKTPSSTWSRNPGKEDS